MEASNIVQAIKNIKEKSLYREFDESIPDVVTRGPGDVLSENYGPSRNS